MARLGTKGTKSLLAAGMVALVVQLLSPSGATALAEPSRTATVEGEPLLPNLVVLRARDLHIVRKNGGRKLRFESGLANIGDGPMEVRPDRAQPCPDGKHHSTQVMYRDADSDGRYTVDVDIKAAFRSAGCMVFHPYHDHWHFEAASRYTLYRASRPELIKVARRKMSFCLIDSTRVPKVFGTFAYANRYFRCGQSAPQGISVGWVDVYTSNLAGQAIRLPRRMRDGLYCLRIKVDPQNQLAETRDNDNTSVRAFRLRGDRIRYRPSAKCRPAG